MTATADLADAYQALLIRDDPLYAVMAGTAPQSLTPLDEEAVRDRAATAAELLGLLDAIEGDDSEADLASVLRALLTADIERVQVMWHEHVTAPYHVGFLFSLVARMAIAPLTGAERARLTAELAERVCSAATLLRGRRERGIVLPGPAVEGARGTWAALSAELSTLLDSPAVDAAMVAVAAEIETSAESAGDAVGMANVPGGEEAYRLLVRQHTTLDLGPEELHRLGLEQCARLAERMAEIRARLGGPEDEDEARSWIAAQKHLYASTPDAVAATYRRHLTRVEPGIDALFRTRPRAGYDVQRLDPADDAYGRLAHERFTAQRLVVDTALNLGSWDLTRARAFMRAHTLDSDRQIASETLRYATDLPAQALAYRSGFLAFQEARESAAGVDPRIVHEAMLTAGAVPLPRMRERVARAVHRETSMSGGRRG
ncbi:DUF885 family protein [Streptomyces sp. NPDC127108]|uniref:DUF885 family protein n=1 Tax=Streptomyces sp. NPDC127108 TaxID=3345361 RepID=UPI0036266929